MKRLLLAALLASRAWAHEGHGDAPVAAAAQDDGRAAIYGSGAEFDAVAKYDPHATGDQVSVTLFLVHAETNRPVAGAAVSASVSDGANARQVAFRSASGGVPGSYEGEVPIRRGVPISFLVDAAAGDTVDMIALDGMRIEEPHAPPAAEMPGSAPPWRDRRFAFGAGAGFAAALAVLLLLRPAAPRSATP